MDMLDDVFVGSLPGPLSYVFDEISPNVGHITPLPPSIYPGMYLCGHFNFELYLLNDVEKYPEFGQDYHDIVPKDEYGDKYFNCYGVCDSPQQFTDLFASKLNSDSRKFVVAFTHIEKDESNKYKGGGWRWHKWGPYVGTGTPTCEYLDDEEKFDDGVYVYRIYEIK